MQKLSVFLMLAPLAACVGDFGGGGETTETIDHFVTVTTTWPSGDIPVCWEDPGNETQKAWVRDAISNAWEAEAAIELIGWDQCSLATHSGIRIQTADLRPSTIALGAQLNNRPYGMTLNFLFNAVAADFPGCNGANNERCIRSTAVREFGHALGFATSQSTSATPASCTPGQELSVLNYCNPSWPNDRFLYPIDIEIAQSYYGARRPIAVEWHGQPLAVNVNAFVRSFSTGSIDGSWLNGLTGQWFTRQLGGYLTSAPAVVGRDPGLTDVFARGGDGALYRRGADASGWGAWMQLGPEPFQGTPAAVARNGEIDVFIIGTDRQLYRKTGSGSTWSAYSCLGGSLIGTPSAVSYGPNKVAVFARGTDGGLWWARFDGSAWFQVSAVRWEPFFGNPSPVSPSPGRIDVIIRGTDCTHYAATWNGSTWSNYQQIDTRVYLGDPAAVSMGTNRIDVFGRALVDNALWTKESTGNGWNTAWRVKWNPFGASPTVISYDFNHLDVFVRGTDNGLYTLSYNGLWQDYFSLGHNFR